MKERRGDYSVYCVAAMSVLIFVWGRMLPARLAIGTNVKKEEEHRCSARARSCSRQHNELE